MKAAGTTVQMICLRRSIVFLHIIALFVDGKRCTANSVCMASDNCAEKSRVPHIIRDAVQPQHDITHRSLCILDAPRGKPCAIRCDGDLGAARIAHCKQTSFSTVRKLSKGCFLNLSHDYPPIVRAIYFFFSTHRYAAKSVSIFATPMPRSISSSP